MNTRDWNETLRSLNVGLPDDVERLKAAGYYEEAIARIDAYLAEDWTMTQNSPYSRRKSLRCWTGKTGWTGALWRGRSGIRTVLLPH